MKLTTIRIISLSVLNVLLIIHWTVWHVFHIHVSGHTDPRQFFDFFRTGVVSPFAILFLAFMILTLFMGRTFCSWFCHMGSWLDAARFVMDRKWKRLQPIHSYTALIISALCLALPLIGIVLHWVNVGFPSEYSFKISKIPVGDKPPIILPFIALFVVVFSQLFFGSRSICRYLCPLGVWLRLFDFFSRARIRRVTAKKCHNCLECNRHCRMGVDINYQINRAGEVKDIQCIKCGTCTTVCPSGLLKYKFSHVKDVEIPLDPNHPPNKQRWMQRPYEGIMCVVIAITVVLNFSVLVENWRDAVHILNVIMYATFIFYIVTNQMQKRMPRRFGKVLRKYLGARFYVEKARAYKYING